VDFGLTDEQRALASTVRVFLADRFDLAAVRRVFEDPDGDGHPLDLWKSIGEQGWLAVLVPEEYDGLGLGLLDAQVIARAFGAGVVPGPWLPTVLAGEALRLAGSPAQQASWLPRIAAGEVVGTVGLDRAVAVTGGVAVGVLPRVEYAGVADLLVVVDPEGGLHTVDPRGDGVTVTPLTQYDGTTRLARVTLEGAPAEALTAGRPDVLGTLAARAAVLTSAELAGIAREAVTRTVAYDKDRVQFGRPVGSFQALKHSLADLHVAATMSEHAALYSAAALDGGFPDAPTAVSVAKSKTSDTAKLATQLMIQYHGGIGYTWEHEAHFFYKRAKRLAAAWGDAATHRELLAALLIDRVGTDAGPVAEPPSVGVSEVSATALPG